MWPRHGALAFRDIHAEADFRHYWEILSHPVSVLASLLLMLRYMALAQSGQETCQMPAAICALRYTDLPGVHRKSHSFCRTSPSQAGHVLLLTKGPCEGFKSNCATLESLGGMAAVVLSPRPAKRLPKGFHA